MTAAGHGNVDGAGIFLWADVNGDPTPCSINNVRVIGNTVQAHITFDTGGGGVNNEVTGNINPAGTGQLKIQNGVNVTISGNTGFTLQNF